MHRKHSSPVARVKAVLALGLVAAAAASFGQAAPQFHIEQVVEFKPGTPKARAMLARVASLRDLVTDPFQVAGVDLNDDGRKEILVMGASSSYCGSGGCLLVVLEQQGNRMATLLEQNVPGALAVTKEKVGAYRALAALDASGAIAIAIANKPGAPMHGKAMVYPMAAGPATSAFLPPGQGSGTSEFAPPAAAARAEVAPTEAAVNEQTASVAGIRLGMPFDKAEAALNSHATSYRGAMRISKDLPLMAMGPDGRSTGTPYNYSIQGRKIAVGAAIAGLAEDHVQIVASPPPGIQRVIAVSRRAVFAGSEQPVANAVLDQLRGRHGSVSLQSRDSHNRDIYFWFLGKNHKSLLPPKLPKLPGDSREVHSLCDKLGNEEYTTLIRNGAQVPDSNLRFHGFFRECGTVLVLSMHMTSLGTVAGYNTLLMDFPAYIDAMHAAHSFLQPQADAARARALDAASKRGAPKI